MGTLPTDVTGMSAAQHRAHHADLHALMDLADAAGDLLVASGGDTWVKLAKGTALQTMRVNAAGTALEWRDPTRHARAIKTGGDVSGSVASSWVAINGSTWDLTIPAAAGDLVEAGFAGRFIQQGGDACWLDLLSIVASAPVNSWARDGAYTTGGAGMQFCPLNQDLCFAQARSRVLAAGDVSGGNLTLRPYWRSNGTSGSQYMCASTSAMPLFLFIRNYGPQA